MESGHSSSSSILQIPLQNVPLQNVPLQNENNIQKRTKKLSHNERQNIIDELLLCARQVKSGKWLAARGKINKVAAQFNISRRTVSSLWSIAKNQVQLNLPVDVRSKVSTNSGWKRVSTFDVKCIEQIPLSKRTTIRSLACAAGLPKSTMHKIIKKGMIRRHSNAIKPFLYDGNKIQRLKFCVSQINDQTLSTNPTFKSFQNVIQIDEKWFFMSNTSQRFYLGLDEEDPHRACKSKRFIAKVMFLAVVARPIINEDSHVLWDGKMGIFPFIETVAAKRKSKNREAGTLEVKPVLSVNKAVYKDMLIQKVLPAIKQKWPAHCNKRIEIQQDNAKPHISGMDEDFIRVATSQGFHITLGNQPPNSPDLNILDLGFFASIQSLRNQCAPKTVSDLVGAVEESFNALSPYTLNKVWLSYQYVMQEVMKVRGGNNYKLPHNHKDMLARLGQLPHCVQLEDGVYQAALDTLNQPLQ